MLNLFENKFLYIYFLTSPHYEVEKNDIGVFILINTPLSFIVLFCNKAVQAKLFNLQIYYQFLLNSWIGTSGFLLVLQSNLPQVDILGNMLKREGSAYTCQG